MARRDWDAYLRAFHTDRPGITELALRHAVDPDVGTAYDWLVDGLPSSPGDVVDVACGNAAVQPWLAGHETYLGVDLSDAELQHASAAGRGPVARGDARRLPLADSSADTVVSSMGLMLVRPVEQAVAEIRRVLRPGGTVAMLVPATWPIHVRDVTLGLPLTLALLGPGSMPQLLGPRRVVRMLTAHGLTPQDVSRRRFPFPVHNAEDAALAIRSLYTPGRTARQLELAESVLGSIATTTAELPVPLMRVVARA
jgi:SAM-dependent methyltransferase